MKVRFFLYDGTLYLGLLGILQSLADEGVTVLKDWPAQRSDFNIIKQKWIELKSLSEESMQSLRVVGVLPQRMASYTCKDGEGFIFISS